MEKLSKPRQGVQTFLPAAEGSSEQSKAIQALELPAFWLGAV